MTNPWSLYLDVDKVHLITLGCPKNAVDSERMHRLLAGSGYSVTDEQDEADVIVVNTCGFIQPAKEESISAVLDAADSKVHGGCRGIIVTGCLAERYRDELAEELPEADVVVGIAGERDIVAHCDRLLGKRPRDVAQEWGDRHLLTPRHWAYLRISDGCDRKCAFCAIPGIRGPSRSESIDVLCGEAQRLADGGVKEIVLIAQDTMRYGVDLYGGPRLVGLLRELVGIEGLHWIRLLYTYPAGWRNELVDLLAGEEKLCSYADMPIQHASDPILRAMNRGTTAEGIRKVVRRLREGVPELTLRSSVIVGFPGEEESHFNELMDFVSEARFNHLVGFLYSHEEGTAAGEGVDDVPDEVKRERLDRVMALQAEIATDINEEAVGQRFLSLIDRASEEPEFDWVGRTRMQAPEIDTEVFIRGPAEEGEFVEVEIVDAMAYDLVGQVVPPEPLLGISPAADAEAPG